MGHPKDVKSLRYRIINYSFITSLPSLPDATPEENVFRVISLVEWVQFSRAAQPFKLVIEVCREIVVSQRGLRAKYFNHNIGRQASSELYGVTVVFHLSYVCLCCSRLLFRWTERKFLCIFFANTSLFFMCFVCVCVSEQILSKSYSRLKRRKN